MKTIVFGSVSAAALLLASTAFAAGNSSEIDQIGYANTASVDQTGSPSNAKATVTQSDEYNDAAVVQGGGSGNVATITQSQGTYGATRNYSNISGSNQQGTNGLVTVIQVGDNTSSVDQLAGSSGEYALVGQSNINNTSAISQGGTKEFALVNQEYGSGNAASIVQSGTGYGNSGPGAGNYTPTPSSPRIHGPGNLWWSENLPGDSVLTPGAGGNTRYGQTGADVDQVGSNNVGSISQAGNQNFADVSQENDTGTGGNHGAIVQGVGVYHSDAVMYQWGQNNIATLSQGGAGTSYSTAWQYGDSNQAYATQDGSETSVIAQGVTGDGPRDGTFIGGISGDYALVDQTSGGDSSRIVQLGSNDTAYVYQTVSANATSLINQGGTYNLAVVHQ